MTSAVILDKILKEYCLPASGHSLQPIHSRLHLWLDISLAIALDSARPSIKAGKKGGTIMSSKLTIHDETPGGGKTNTFTLDCLTEEMTVRELLRARIYQEVQDYNLKEPEYFRGLVQPSEAEKTLNGYKLRKQRKIDWQEQYQHSLEAFERNGFFVLIDNQQAESLDQIFEVKADTEVNFVKLVPLVGG